MKRVLFLAYLFPPIANSGTQRPLKFAKYLSQHDWSPIVMTAAGFNGHTTDPSLLGEIPAGTEVLRVPMVQERITEVLQRALGRGIGRRIGDAAGWRLRRRYRSPDVYALWRPTVTRAALRLFEESGFDVIYATGFPWTSLVAGADIARLTGRPLIADFRDLWAGEPHFMESRGPRHRELALERRVVGQAHTVIGASHSIVHWLRNAHPEADDKFVAIHNGFDAADLATTFVRPRRERFRIVYTGVWKYRYNPAELYESIEWLCRACPHIVGRLEVIAAGFPPGEAARRKIDHIVTETGHVRHAEAVQLMQSADALFLTHTDPDRQWAVPGKLYEYLASGTPVLAVTPAEKETAKIIGDLGGGVVIDPEDPGALYEALRGICQSGRFAAPPRNDAALATFERRALTAKLAAVLDAAYTTRSSRAGSSAGSPTRSSYAGSTSAQPATRVVS